MTSGDFIVFFISIYTSSLKSLPIKKQNLTGCCENGAGTKDLYAASPERLPLKRPALLAIALTSFAY
jgi:hypothetical protein